MSTIPKSRFQAIKDAFRKLWVRATVSPDAAASALAVELAGVFPPVTRGVGAPVEPAPPVSVFGDLYINETTGQLYSYTSGGWIVTGGGVGMYYP